MPVKLPIRFKILNFVGVLTHGFVDTMPTVIPSLCVAFTTTLWMTAATEGTVSADLAIFWIQWPAIIALVTQVIGQMLSLALRNHRLTAWFQNRLRAEGSVMLAMILSYLPSTSFMALTALQLQSPLTIFLTAAIWILALLDMTNALTDLPRYRKVA